MIAKDCMSQQFSSPVPDHFLRAEPAIRGQGQSWETCAAPIGKGSDTTGKALPKLLFLLILPFRGLCANRSG